MQTAVSNPLQKTFRIDSIDLLRGLVMIIMALDHTRDFFNKNGMIQDPANLATTTPVLFLTRWVTHFCAPVFVFLSGASVWFQSFRKSKGELSMFLIKRGLWLIFIEIVIMNFAFFFNPHYPLIALQVIWSIGISMIILALMIWLPFTVIVVTGSVIVLGHNALDFYERTHMGSYPFLYSLMHTPGVYTLWKGHQLFVLYPFLPWTGLMIVGYCFGKLFTKYEGIQRRKILTWLGLGVIIFFMALRASNRYGNPEPWSTQKNSLFTFFSFINTRKYPPSLLYMCMTIGPAILFLAWFGNIKSKLSKIVTVYGRVPFFYYVIHFYLIHLVSSILYLSRGHSFADGMTPRPFLIPQFVDPKEGYSLWIVYLIWFCIVVSLYPLCKWFSSYKLRHREKKWLSYL